MSGSEHQWIYPENNPVLLEKIVREFHIHPVIAQFFVSRGFNDLDEIHSFLYAKLPQLHPPRLFPDMDKAVKRILSAWEKREKVLVYADNDVDGMSGGALLSEFLRKIGVNVVCYIPNTARLKKNLSEDAFNYAKSESCSLLITVDCSVGSTKDLSKIDRSHVDLIITDHHEPTKKLPHSIATLNPKLIESTYPNRELTGVGVAFKLAHAVLNALTEKDSIISNPIDLKDFLDLVALGTVADMGALVRENRILVRYGLEVLKRTKRIGLEKLFRICGLDITEVSPIDIALKVAPRLNSLGRIANPQKGVELLLETSEKKAEKLASTLNAYNTQRQKIEKNVTEDVQNLIERSPEILENKALVLHSDKWHSGIIPIIASKISRQYNRPTVIISVEGTLGKGSIRTISEFPLIPILKKYKHLLENFGGHDFAAGLTIKKECIEEFKKGFIQEANETIEEGDIAKKLFLDARMDFQDLTFDFMESLKLLEPFGNENTAPLFYTDVKQYKPPRVVGKTHLKLYLEQKDRTLEGIAFGMAERKKNLLEKEGSFRILFTPHVNTFFNKATIQLHVRDF